MQLGLLMSSFPAPALSSSRRRGFPVGSLFAMVALGAGGSQWDGTSEEMMKMNCDFHCYLFSGRTIQASHFLGPSSYLSFPYSSIEHQENCPHPF